MRSYPYNNPQERKEIEALAAEWLALRDQEDWDRALLEWARKHFHRRHEKSSFGLYLRDHVGLEVWEQVFRDSFNAVYEKALNENRCERCGEKTRQVVTTPLGKITQDWNAESGRSVAEIDEDVCDQCGEDIIAASEEDPLEMT